MVPFGQCHVGLDSGASGCARHNELALAEIFLKRPQGASNWEFGGIEATRIVGNGNAEVVFGLGYVEADAGGACVERI